MRIARPIVEFFQPLSRKLPLLIAALLCAVVATFGLLAHRELERVIDAAAADRLLVASQRLAAMLGESATGFRTETRTIASDSAVLAVLDRPSDAAKSAATAALTSQRSPTQIASRMLWTKSCELVLAVGPLKGAEEMTRCPARTTAGDVRRFSLTHDWLQPLALRGDTVWYAGVAPVVRASGDTIGYLVQARVFGGTGGQMISSLIGKDATLMIGNASGEDVWSDLSKRVAGPSRGGARGVVARYTPPSGSEQLGVATNVPSTPWLVWVEMPTATVMAPLYQTLSRVGGLAIICVVLGVIGAWFLGRHVTMPIVELTRAEEDFAAGNYARRVSGTRHDELGRLMTSFNRMASHVEEATQELNAQAVELELQFHEAQELAHELELSNQELSEAAEETVLAHRDRESAQALLDDVLTQAPVGIAVFDAQLRFVRVNHAFSVMDGVAERDHVGKLVNAVMPSVSMIGVPQLETVLATGGSVTNQRSSGAIQGGAKRHWLGSYFPVRGPNGEVTGVGAVLVDTTAHFDLEAQLLQAQKMEAVGRLAGGVAHDFNNLLTVISSYSQMALESLSADDDLYADMKEIRSAADRASRLTKQLLAFSRKQVLQPQVLDLNRVASEMERMLRRLIGEDVVLTLKPSEDLGEVRADPGQIEQVIMNLALNARDAMPDGGRLVISTANLTLDADLTVDTVTVPAGDYVTLSVSDTGSGMTDETREHLFEPFYTTKAVGQGTGLGLSTVYGIIKQSGGEIAVLSTAGRGSTFVTYLPRTRRNGRAPMRTPTSSTRACSGGTETILLVEDDGALRDLARRILKGAGYTVLEARTANAAIELGTNYPAKIDLLLTDVVMPQQNGRAVGEHLTRLRPELRVLFMSGYTDDDVMKRGVSSTVASFLQKPFTPEQLVRRIREVLDEGAVSVN
ncbi:MAG: ATP-binding protein [bacterium]